MRPNPCTLSHGAQARAREQSGYMACSPRARAPRGPARRRPMPARGEASQFGEALPWRSKIKILRKAVCLRGTRLLFRDLLRECGVGAGGVIRRDQVGCSQRARQHQPPHCRGAAHAVADGKHVLPDSWTCRTGATTPRKLPAWAFAKPSFRQVLCSTEEFFFTKFFTARGAHHNMLTSEIIR